MSHAVENNIIEYAIIKNIGWTTWAGSELSQVTCEISNPAYKCPY
jgi:hypothetical protein